MVLFTELGEKTKQRICGTLKEIAYLLVSAYANGHG